MKAIEIKTGERSSDTAENKVVTVVQDKVYVVWACGVDLEDIVDDIDIDSIFVSKESAVEYLEDNGCVMKYEEDWYGVHEVWELNRLSRSLRFTIEEFDLLGLK